MSIYLLLKTSNVPTFSGYKLQGRMRFQGMAISIENKKGSIRSGTDQNGKKWRTKMTLPYGYIKKTQGADKDHVDCFIGSNHDSRLVYVIHQVRPDTGKFDEDKVMLGFDDPNSAKVSYLSNYDSKKYFGSMDEMTIDEFKKKVFGSRKGKKII